MIRERTVEMIQIIKERIDTIPMLHVVKAELHNQALPTMIYLHGYNGEKISSLTLAYKIAEKGYRVILPDCLYHGDRNENKTQTELDLAFWEIVVHTIKEIPFSKDASGKGYSNENIGLGGTSMGGIITYGALRQYEWIKAAAVLMGTAYMSDYAKQLIKQFNKMNTYQITEEEKQEVTKLISPFDLSLQPDALHERPLLIWHGEDDQVVPYQYSPSFYESIKHDYHDKGQIRFVSEKGRSHHVSRLAMNEAASWIAANLSS